MKRSRQIEFWKITAELFPMMALGLRLTVITAIPMAVVGAFSFSPESFSSYVISMRGTRFSKV
jgi:hypothetical protein